MFKAIIANTLPSILLGVCHFIVVMSCATVMLSGFSSIERAHPSADVSVASLAVVILAFPFGYFGIVPLMVNSVLWGCGWCFLMHSVMAHVRRKHSN